MSVLIENNKKIHLNDFTNVHDKLPVGNYILKYNEMTGEYYLSIQEDFKFPRKIYGNHDYIKRWIKSYEHNSEKNLGILLSGVKGSGKTIAAQLFCKEINLPVIFITESFKGSNFETYLTNPCFNNCIIFIDEFEKVYSEYDDGESTSLLGLMDGLYNSKLIFLLTVNDSENINSKLKNRLNRIKYHKCFNILDSSIAEEVINDLLIYKNFKSSILKFMDLFTMTTMDILTSLIKEINLFNEDAIVCASYLNLMDESSFYNVSVEYKGKEYACEPQYCNLSKDFLRIIYTSSNYNEDYDEDENPTENKDSKFLKNNTYLRIKNYKSKSENGILIFDINDDYKVKLNHKKINLIF